MSKILTFPQKKQSQLKRFIHWLTKTRYITFEVDLSKDEIFFQKVKFLHRQAFNYFLDYHKMRIGNSVDFHPEVYAQKDAINVIHEVVMSGKVEKLYAQRKKALKELQVS